MEEQKELDHSGAKETILITHYVNPQLFCYTTLHQLQIGGAYVNHVEAHLSDHCHAHNQRENYAPDKHVVVRYQPLHMEKLLRGLVIVCQHGDEYLVWAMDYGFTINCRAKDLWLLPEQQSERYVEIAWGGIAWVAPRKGSEWSKMAVRMLDKRMDEAQRLIFKVQHRNNERHNFGQLLMDEPPIDAASYLVERQCARLEVNEVSMMCAQSSRVAYDVDLAELNEPDIKPSLRVMTILQLMQRFKVLPKVELQPGYKLTASSAHSEQQQNYVDSIFKNGYHRLGNKTRNLTCPSKQSARLDSLLQCRTAPGIPASAKRLSKIKSNNDGVVDTALNRSHGSSNSSSSTCSTDSFDALEQQTTNKRNSRNILEFYKRPMSMPQPNQQKLEQNKSLPHQQPKKSMIEKLPTFDFNQELMALSPSASNSLFTIQELPDNQAEQCISKAEQGSVKLLTNKKLLSSHRNPCSQSAKLENINEHEILKTSQSYPDKVDRLYDTSLKKEPLNTSEDQPLPFDENKLKCFNDPSGTKVIRNSEDQSATLNPDKLESIYKNINAESLKTCQDMHLSNNLDKPGYNTTETASVKTSQEQSSAPDKPERICGYLNTNNSKTSEHSSSNPDKYDSCNSSSGTESLTTSKHPSALNPHKLESIYNAYRLRAKANDLSVHSVPELEGLENQVLAHSKIKVQPIHSLADSLLCADVLLAMRDMNVKPTLATQRYAWPHLANGHSLVLVDRAGSGRSWCYLPTLCSLVIRSMRTLGKGPTLGPLALLLADSVANAQALFNQCNQLMSAYKTNMLKVVNTHGHTEKELQLRLLNACGILVTTPTHLKELLQHEMQLIDPRRLKHFIIDDYDRVNAAQPHLLNELLQLLQNFTKFQLQLVVIAQQWHGKVFLELLKRHGDNPLLLFGDFLEAAIYGSIKLSVTLLHSDRKIGRLLDYLTVQNPLQRRTIIYCKHELELAALREALTAAGYDCIGSIDAAGQVRGKV